MRDANGNLDIVDGSSHSVVVVDRSGRSIRSIGFVPGTWVQRVAADDRGGVSILFHDQDGTFVERRDSSYAFVYQIDVSEPCPSNPIASDVADVAIDGEGNVWVADLTGCGAAYRLRKYSPDGAVLGKFERVGQFDAATIESAPQRLLLVADLFASGATIYAILGSTNREAVFEVDAWDLSGSYLGRSPLPGPKEPMLQATVHDDQAFIVDTLGGQSISVLSLTQLKSRSQ